ncbi:hypothetical protein DQ04_13521000, partial [Trypanosoma grayi]|uniref:hypothetical protein n=1 Tax=Trypanosoma grayi TaxID=71804 RepID=UPI0004F42F7D
PAARLGPHLLLAQLRRRPGGARVSVEAEAREVLRGGASAVEVFLREVIVRARHVNTAHVGEAALQVLPLPHAGDGDVLLDLALGRDAQPTHLCLLVSVSFLLVLLLLPPLSCPSASSLFRLPLSATLRGENRRAKAARAGSITDGDENSKIKHKEREERVSLVSAMLCSTQKQTYLLPFPYCRGPSAGGFMPAHPHNSRSCCCLV